MKVSIDKELLVYIAGVFTKIQEALLCGELTFNDESGLPSEERKKVLIDYIDQLGVMLIKEVYGAPEQPMSALWNREEEPPEA